LCRLEPFEGAFFSHAPAVGARSDMTVPIGVFSICRFVVNLLIQQRSETCGIPGSASHALFPFLHWSQLRFWRRPVSEILLLRGSLFFGVMLDRGRDVGGDMKSRVHLGERTNSLSESSCCYQATSEGNTNSKRGVGFPVFYISERLPGYIMRGCKRNGHQCRSIRPPQRSGIRLQAAIHVGRMGSQLCNQILPQG